MTSETFDDQPPVSKRLRLQPLPPNVSDSAYASIPQACADFASQQAHPEHLGQDKRISQKQELSNEVDIQPLRKGEIIESGTVGKIDAVENYMVHSVSTELDSHVEQTDRFSNKDTNENVIDIKMNANGSTDDVLSKKGKTKRGGISLMELFTPEQIYEHIHSLRQWVGQVFFFTRKKGIFNTLLFLLGNGQSSFLFLFKEINSLAVLELVEFSSRFRYFRNAC